MLFYCAYSWHPQTTIEQVRARHDRQFAAGALHPEHWRGFYELPAMGRGFLLIESDDARALGEEFQPYSDLMRWDIHPVRENDIAATIEVIRRRVQRAG